MSNQTRRGSYRAALRRHDLRLALSALLVSQIGSWAYATALTVYIWDRTHSTGWVAAVALSSLLPALVFSPYGGVLADRFERRHFMIILDGLNTVWLTLLAIATLARGPLLLLILLSVMSSLTNTPYRSATAAALPTFAGEEQLAAANALNGSIDNLTILAGPALGALLLLLGPAWVVFLLDAATFAASALMLSRCTTRSGGARSATTERTGTLAKMAVGFKVIGGSSTVLLLVGFCALDSFYAGLTKVLFVSISVHVGSGATGYGYLLTSFGVGGLLAAFVSNRLASADRLAPVVVAGMAALYLPLAAEAAVGAPVPAAILQVLAGGGMMVVDVVAITALQRSTQDEQLARVFGVFWAIIIGAISLGSLVSPFALHALGLHGALLLFGVGVTGVSVLAYPVLRASDRRSLARLTLLRPRIDVLQALGLFAAASRPVVERLAGAAQEITVAPGIAVVREGELADALYVILDGEVAVTARGESGVDRFIRNMGPNTYFGEIGLLEDVPRTATVTAVGDCRLLRIEGDDFISAISESPASPTLVDGVRTRLAVTHPHRPATVAEKAQPAVG